MIQKFNSTAEINDNQTLSKKRKHEDEDEDEDSPTKKRVAYETYEDEDSPTKKCVAYETSCDYIDDEMRNHLIDLFQIYEIKDNDEDFVEMCLVDKILTTCAREIATHISIVETCREVVKAAHMLPVDSGRYLKCEELIDKNRKVLNKLREILVACGARLTDAKEVLNDKEGDLKIDFEELINKAAKVFTDLEGILTGCDAQLAEVIKIFNDKPSI